MHYHLIWTTYGTWLPGDERGWMKKGDSAVQLPDPGLVATIREQMKEELVLLDAEQCRIVTETIRTHCQTRNWTICALAVRTNHVHVILQADREGSVIRDQLKAWCSRKLSDHADLQAIQSKTGGRRRWFTEGAYLRRIETEDYLEAAVAYVQAQANTPSP
jgi:REP element-mobilizing transposase RayT